MVRKVHIIDDDKDFADSLADVLSSQNYAVVTSYDGKSGIERLDPKNPSLCLLDIRIGNENGIDILEVIAGEMPDIVCIILTAYADTETAIQALKRGAYDYLRKPLEIEDLFATLRRGFHTIELKQEREQARADLEARNNELSTLNERLRHMVEAARELAACRTPEELDKTLLDEFARNMAARGGSLYACEKSELVLIHTIGPNHAAERISLPLQDNSPMATVIESKTPLLIPDIDRDGHLKPSGWTGYEDGSTLCFPIVDANGALLGVANLHNKAWPPFTRQDLDLGRILISLTGEVMRSLNSMEKLARRERHFRELFENSPAVNLLIDSDGIVLDANEAAGVSRNSVIGKRFADLLPEEERPIARRRFAAIKNGDRLPPAEIKVELDNKIHVFYLPAGRQASITESGDLIGYIIAGIDITELKLMQKQAEENEAQLFQASKLASLGTLIAGIAHEINNPNNYIRLNAQNLIEFWNDAKSMLDSNLIATISLQGLPLDSVVPMVDDMLEGLEEGSVRIEKLIQNLREYARKDTTDLNESVDLNSVVETSIQIMKSTIDKATGYLSVDLDAALPPVTGNYHQIEQVVINLLANACQSLEKRQQPIHVRTFVRNERITIEVADKGCGMDADAMQFITDPFFTTKRESGGTGLGLSVSARIIQNHGGSLIFSSSPGEGTVASAEIPVRLV